MESGQRADHHRSQMRSLSTEWLSNLGTNHTRGQGVRQFIAVCRERVDGGGKVWLSQPGGNRTGSCAGPMGWVRTQHQLEGTISTQDTEQWLPNTGVWPAGAKVGKNVPGSCQCSIGGLSPSLSVFPTLSALSLMGWLPAAFPSLRTATEN